MLVRPTRSIGFLISCLMLAACNGGVGSEPVGQIAPSKSEGAASTGVVLNSPQGDIFDSSGDLWVANSGANEVIEYTVAQLAKRNPKPIVVITNGLNSPTRLAFAPTDSSDLWVTNIGASSVAEYDISKPTKPRVVLTEGIDRPLAVAVDDHGNVYVGNNSGDSITVYARTGGAPLQTWTSDNQGHQFVAPGAMFLGNSSGNKPELYAGFGPGSQQNWVASFSLSSVLKGPIPHVRQYFTSGISGPTGVWAGDDEKPVYVANFYASTVVGFYVKRGDAQTIDTQGQPNGVAVSPLDGNIYVAIGGDSDILVYSPKGRFLKTLQ